MAYRQRKCSAASALRCIGPWGYLVLNNNALESSPNPYLVSSTVTQACVGANYVLRRIHTMHPYLPSGGWSTPSKPHCWPRRPSEGQAPWPGPGVGRQRTPRMPLPPLRPPHHLWAHWARTVFMSDKVLGNAGPRELSEKNLSQQIHPGPYSLSSWSPTVFGC